MHRKRFGKPLHDIWLDDCDFSIRSKFKYDDDFATDDQFSIYKNPDGMDILLTNWSYLKLRAAKRSEQTVFHLNWDETKKLRDFLNKQLKERDEEDKS